ncbi:MAG: hypothetical protein IT168_29925 [Bryobacterales bacterium]|nr:hypothetical protein [Bryobacterales bacterium]
MRIRRRFGVVICFLAACRAQSQNQASPADKALENKRSLSFRPASSDLAQMSLRAAEATLPGPPSSITLENLGRDDQKNRPVTVSHSFAKGDIPRCPQAVIDGKAVETQCDVKTRWPDKSVRHTLITFFADIPNGGKTKVAFQDQAPPPATPLTKEQMLGFMNGAWGAAFKVSADGEEAGPAVLRDARQILEAWDGKETGTGVRFWLKGPLVTQAIVEDKASSRFDFGWSNAQPFARVGSDVHANTLEFDLTGDTRKSAAEWQLPGLMYSANQILEICDYRNGRLRICPQGRSKTEQLPSRIRPGEIIAPATGWIPAKEEKYKSLHPAFVLTFYKGWAGVKVEYILENTYAQRKQTQVYHVQTLRNQDKTPVGPDRWLVHWPKSRWRYTAWSGQDPGPLHIDHNFPYLVYARALPSYDLTLHPSSEAIRGEYDFFRQSDRGDPMGRSVWLEAFEAPGARGDIAFIPRWYTRYLYSADPRMWEAFVGTAAVSGHVPIHARDAMANKQFCPHSCEQSPTVQGRVVSVEARPSVNHNDAQGEDKMPAVGPSPLGGWSPDIAHLPDFAFVPYLLTGDYYFLEELHFWASVIVTSGNPSSDCDYCRHGDWGMFGGEIRGRAWGLRTLGFAVLMSPDGTPEKSYFTDKFNNHIAIDEGFFDLKQGSFYEPCPEGPYNPWKTTRWCWGRNTMSVPQLTAQSNPLYSYERVSMPPEGFLWREQDFPTNPPSPTLPKPWAVPVYSVSSEWQQNFHLLVTGALLDMGLTQIAEIHARTATRLLQQLKSPDYNPYLVGAYRTPAFACRPELDPKQNKYICKPNGRFTNWKDIKNGFKEEPDVPKGNFLWRSITAFYDTHLHNPDGGYPYAARAAASFLPGMTYEGLNGKEAWDWIAEKGCIHEELRNNPAYAFVPRSENAYGLGSQAPAQSRPSGKENSRKRQ